jgi:ATP-dependent Clp protease ATP-binding subunit ClpA
MMGFNPQYGARPILGIIRKQLRHPLSKLIISGTIKSGDTVEVVIGVDGNPEFITKK